MKIITPEDDLQREIEQLLEDVLPRFLRKVLGKKGRARVAERITNMSRDYVMKKMDNRFKR